VRFAVGPEEGCCGGVFVVFRAIVRNCVDWRKLESLQNSIVASREKQFGVRGESKSPGFEGVGC
jgi:hypothetical protein